MNSTEQKFTIEERERIKSVGTAKFLLDYLRKPVNLYFAEAIDKITDDKTRDILIRVQVYILSEFLSVDIELDDIRIRENEEIFKRYEKEEDTKHINNIKKVLGLVFILTLLNAISQYGPEGFGGISFFILAGIAYFQIFVLPNF
jgi:hypothetical protein